MKIGIITFHSAQNYGAVLQCFALSEKLKEFGHDVYLVDLPLHSKHVTFRSKLRNKFITQSFVKFRRTSLSKVVDINYNVDFYVFGSDQIWNPQITKSNLLLYMGSWIKENKKKIAYAASFGISEWNFPKYTEEASKELNKFQSIGIREESGQIICRDVFQIESQKVLDPTFLIKDYNKIFKKIKQTNNMVCYIFEKNKEKIDELVTISYIKNYKPVLLNDMRLRKKIKSIPFPTVSKWVAHIESSNFVITDSFHCMVFAILFKKNFIALPAAPDRVGRMLSLLKDLKLESRFFNEIKDIKNSEILHQDIDYDVVFNKINILKKISLDFLEKSVNSI